MSHDAQHRPPQPLPELSALLRASLKSYGYPFTGAVLACAECGPQTKLDVTHELIGLDWSIACERCGERLDRTYTDPIDAIGRWNQRQLERTREAAA
jgi:DNA-directed RNA polymerase subunit RPC12/RpoP